MEKYNKLIEFLESLDLEDLKVVYFKDGELDFITVVRTVNGEEVYKISKSYSTLTEAANELIKYFKKEYK